MTKQNAQYLESKVLTAPSHRLHLMLIEGAIRFGRQAQEALSRGDRSAAAAPLLKLMDIVGEMLAGVRGQRGKINGNLAQLYWFLFRLTSEAKIDSDREKLAAALRLLEYERQTWQIVCDKVGSEPSPTSSAPHAGLKLEA
jgi:flagellar protein FliS